MEAEGAAGKDCDVREHAEQCFQKEQGVAMPKAAERSREVGKCPFGSALRGHAPTAESSSRQQGGLKVHWRQVEGAQQVRQWAERMEILGREQDDGHLWDWGAARERFMLSDQGEGLVSVCLLLQHMVAYRWEYSRREREIDEGCERAGPQAHCLVMGEDVVWGQSP